MEDEQQGNLTIPAENVQPIPATSYLRVQNPSTAPAGLILLKFWLKTRKLLLNEVRALVIGTPNRLGAAIEKSPGEDENLPPRKERG